MYIFLSICRDDWLSIPASAPGASAWGADDCSASAWGAAVCTASALSIAPSPGGTDGLGVDSPPGVDGVGVDPTASGDALGTVGARLSAAELARTNPASRHCCGVNGIVTGCLNPLMSISTTVLVPGLAGARSV